MWQTCGQRGGGGRAGRGSHDSGAIQGYRSKPTAPMAPCRPPRVRPRRRVVPLWDAAVARWLQVCGGAHTAAATRPSRRCTRGTRWRRCPGRKKEAGVRIVTLLGYSGLLLGYYWVKVPINSILRKIYRTPRISTWTIHSLSFVWGS
jgi:hypothetical protein